VPVLLSRPLVKRRSVPSVGAVVLLALLPLVEASAPADAAAPAAPERFSDQPNDTWGTSSTDGDDRRAGKVWTIMEAGPYAYFGGEFTGVVPPSVKVGSNDGLVAKPYLVRMDIASGQVDQSWSPDPDGFVRGLAVSPDGRRLYVGGSFNRIDGQPARNLVAFDVDTGRLDTAFTAPHLNTGIRSLALSPDGRVLYAGGGFTTVRVRAGQPNAGEHNRPLVAAFDAQTGALLDWKGPAKKPGQYGPKGQSTRSDGEGDVYWLTATRDGKRLYAGGTFMNFGGEDGLVSIDAETGKATGWQPSDKGCSTGKSTCRPFYGIALHPHDDDSFYATGDGFGGVVISFTYGKSPKGNWQVATDGGGHAVAATRDVVYIGGHWDCAGTGKCDIGNDADESFRRHLAALDPATGKVLVDWKPKANTKTGPYMAYLGTDHLYVGGEFSRINDRPQPGIVQFPRQAAATAAGSS
jgi:large repetitive protein